MQGSILQFAQIAVDRRLRGAELRRHLADSALHIEDARLLQVVHDAYFFVHRQAVGRQDAAGHIGDGGLHRVGQAADEVFDAQRGAGLLMYHAERQKLLRHPAVFGGVKVDAEHPDKLGAVLDEHGRGAQPPLGLRCTLIARDIGLLLVHPAVDEPQRHVGQRRTLGAAADVVVHDGCDGALLAGQVVQHHLIVRPQRLAQKRDQRPIRLQPCVHVRHHFPLLHKKNSENLFSSLCLYHITFGGC